MSKDKKHVEIRKINLDDLEKYELDLKNFALNSDKYSKEEKKVSDSEKKISEDLLNQREEAYNKILGKVHVNWLKGETVNRRLKSAYGYTILIALLIQIIVLIFISYRIVFTEQELKNIGAYSIFITGVFGQMIFIPKVIAQHLFPIEQQNHLYDVMKVLLVHDENNKKSKNDNKDR